MVDFRWICKVTDYGLQKAIATSNRQTAIENEKPAAKLLWTAPELMASDVVQGTKMADVYSFGVIVQEVTLQDEPFAGKHLDSEEIVQKIREGDMSMKPEVPDCK